MLPFASPEEKRPPYRQPLQDTDSGFRANPNNTHSTVIPFPCQVLYPSGFHCGAPKTTQQRFEHVTAENVPFKIPALSYRLTTGNRYYSNVGATDTLISSGFGQRGVLRPLASASRTLRVVLPGSRGGVSLENKENNALISGNAFYARLMFLLYGITEWNYELLDKRRTGKHA